MEEQLFHAVLWTRLYSLLVQGRGSAPSFCFDCGWQQERWQPGDAHHRSWAGLSCCRSNVTTLLEASDPEQRFGAGCGEGGWVANCCHTALFPGSAWVLGLKVHSAWYQRKGECKSFERSKGSQAGSLHKSIRKLNTVKSPCCLPAVPTMKTEIILVKHDLWSARWRN